MPDHTSTLYSKKINAFFETAAEGSQLPAAIATSDDIAVARIGINTTQGTFLARSEDKRARALASIMALHDLEAAARATIE